MICPRCGNVTNSNKVCPICGYDLSDDYKDLMDRQKELIKEHNTTGNIKYNKIKESNPRTYKRANIEKENPIRAIKIEDTDNFNLSLFLVSIILFLSFLGLSIGLFWYLLSPNIEENVLIISSMAIFSLASIIFAPICLFKSNFPIRYHQKNGIYFSIIGILVTLLGAILLILHLTNDIKLSLLVPSSLLVVGFTLMLSNRIVENSIRFR